MIKLISELYRSYPESWLSPSRGQRAKVWLLPGKLRAKASKRYYIRLSQHSRDCGHREECFLWKRGSQHGTEEQWSCAGSCPVGHLERQGDLQRTWTQAMSIRSRECKDYRPRGKPWKGLFSLLKFNVTEMKLKIGQNKIWQTGAHHFTPTPGRWD